MFTKVNYNYGNLDSRQFPDYEPFGVKEMVDDYSDATRLLYRYSRPYPRPFIITTARSCPYSCSFCLHRSDRIPYRSRSIENIMAEIKEMYERYNFNILIIIDELFVVSKKRMREFCEAILEGKAKYGWDFDWMFQTHANARLDLECFQMAKKAGCYLFSYGLESASPTVLKSMNKHTKPEQIIEGIQLSEQAGICYSGNLIFGDPAETPETICESVAFFAKYCEKAMVFCSIVMPYPGSKLFDDLVANGTIKDKAKFYESLSSGVMYNMTKMPNDVFRPWIDFVHYLDRSWNWVKTTKATAVTNEEDSLARESLVISPMVSFFKQKMYRIHADCPYCGTHIMYRNALSATPEGKFPPNTFIGVGCTQCQRKIKVIL